MKIVYLKRLFEGLTFKVGDTEGAEKFEGSNVFEDRVYGIPDKVLAREALATKAVIRQLVETGRFADFFPTLGENRPRWKSRGQVLDFCRNHRFKLSKHGATLFEMEANLIVRVHLVDKGPLAIVGKFSDDPLWYKAEENYIISPATRAEVEEEMEMRARAMSIEGLRRSIERANEELAKFDDLTCMSEESCAWSSHRAVWEKELKKRKSQKS